MGLGLSLSLSPRLEQRLDLRQRLEQRLEQRLAQQLTLKIGLELYLEREELFNGFMAWADEHNSWAEFDKDGFKFTYARIPYRLAKPIADRYGFGFAHCQYNPFDALINGKKVALARGDWTLFVVGDKIDSGLEDFVAIHERGEQLSLGDHYFASQLEFALASKRRVMGKYVQFIDREAPTKFVDLAQKVHFPILPEELVDFLKSQGKRNDEELRIAEKLIDKYPLPLGVLKLMEKYDNATETVCEAIRKGVGFTQYALAELFAGKAPEKYTHPQQTADLVDAVLRTILSSIPDSAARVISRPRVEDALASYSRDVGQESYFRTERHLLIPRDFDEAYKICKEGKRIVRLSYTAADANRPGFVRNQD